MMPLFIREDQVEKLLTVREAIPFVETAFRALGEGRADNRPRQRVKTEGGVLHLMPAALDGLLVGFKAYTSFRGKTRFHVHLFDGITGDYLAIIQADRLGQIRTGAASGVATKYLARENASSVGIIGTGWQAQSQLEAVCAVRQIHSIRCYSRSAEHRSDFASKMSARLGVGVDPVEEPRMAAHDNDIVIAATSSSSPVLMGEWLSPGTHVNAIGSNWAHKQEIDETTVKRSDHVVVDSLEQAKIESGGLLAPVSKGLLDWSSIDELSQIVTGQNNIRKSPDEITLFVSHGIALEDIAVAGWVLQRAHEQHIGELLSL